MNAPFFRHGDGLEVEHVLTFATVAQNAQEYVGSSWARKNFDGVVDECDAVLKALALLENHRRKRLRACCHVRRKDIRRQQLVFRFNGREQPIP